MQLAIGSLTLLHILNNIKFIPLSTQNSAECINFIPLKFIHFEYTVFYNKYTQKILNKYKNTKLL